MSHTRQLKSNQNAIHTDIDSDMNDDTEFINHID